MSAMTNKTNKLKEAVDELNALAEKAEKADQLSAQVTRLERENATLRSQLDIVARVASLAVATPQVTDQSGL